MWVQPASRCGSQHTALCGYKGAMIHLVPSLWLTTVTLGTLAAITMLQTRRQSSEKGGAPPAMARSRRLPMHWTARTPPQHSATAVSVTQGPTDCTDLSDSHLKSLPHVSVTDHSLVGATKLWSPTETSRISEAQDTSTAIAQPSLQSGESRPSHSPSLP